MEIYPAQINTGFLLTFGIFSSVLICWQLKLEGIHVDEEKTINDPELLMEVIVFIVFLISFIYPVKNTQSIFIKHPMQLWIVMTPSKMKSDNVLYTGQ